MAKFIGVFSKYMLPEYEKNCLNEYMNGETDKMVFLNKAEDSLKAVMDSIVSLFGRFLGIQLKGTAWGKLAGWLLARLAVG